MDSLLQWADTLLDGVLTVAVIAGTLKLGSMVGDIKRWLQTIDSSLRGHIVKNDKAHKELHMEQGQMAEKVANIEGRLSASRSQPENHRNHRPDRESAVGRDRVGSGSDPT